MGSLRGHHAHDFIDAYDEYEDVHSHFERMRYRDQKLRPTPAPHAASRALRRGQPSESFKCLNCKAFIGMPLTGGKHRNHCPACLWSRHVDLKTPGDRASECRSMMQPAAAFARPGGEQVVVHRCRGCGVDRYCRVAADDSPLLLMRLPLVAPNAATAAIAHDEEVGAA